MSLGAGFRSVYDEIKNLRIRSNQKSELPPNMPGTQKQTLKRTQSKDRSFVGGWRETRCCCQQRVNESERVCRKMGEENAELRRLCIYLDDQRQQALNELAQWKNGRQTGSCWYSDPCCGSNCEFQHPNNQSNASLPKESDSPILQQQNEELLSYIHSLESRILTLEEGKTSIHRDGILLGKTRRPVRSVSQQHSPMNSTSPTCDYTLHAQQKQIHIMDSSQSTLTDSGTTYYSSELDRDSDEEESNSAATTVYVKRASNTANNLEQFVSQKRLVDQEKSAVGIVRKFLSTRESLLHVLKKRNDIAGDFGYAVIQRKNRKEHLSESSDLPPSLPELLMKRKFTAENPINNGRQLSRQVA